jgi:Low molecular weight phosphotyrosine protein phosphatase/Major intrinsic protein
VTLPTTCCFSAPAIPHDRSWPRASCVRRGEFVSTPSAGSHPKGEVNPLAIKVLDSFNYPTDGYRSKPWDEFAGPDAPQLDFVFTVCDSAAGEACPIWPRQPMTAHWGIEDPARFERSAVPWLVGLYIIAAYWFTASTSFANPAVAIARSLTNTFSGIRPIDLPGFIVAESIGAVCALTLMSWLLREQREASNALKAEA